MAKSGYRFTRLSFALIAFIYLASSLHFKQWETGSIIGGGDPMGYHIYLPAFFLNHDLTSLHKSASTLFSYQNYKPNGSAPCGIGECYPTPTGKSVIKYTMGVAMLQSPFFSLAHLLAKQYHYPLDGFSAPYIFMNCLSIIFYSLLGLWIVANILNRYVSDKATAFTLLAVALGTNLFASQITMGAMAHPYLFFLYALLLWSTIVVFEEQKPTYLFLVALSAGFITCIRPTEILVLLIPAAYGIYSVLTLNNRFRWMIKHRLYIAIAVPFFFLPIVPQLIYWKAVSGNWVFYSYGSEGFDFAHPHLLDGLFCFKNGWLSYTPIMFFALLGFLLLRKKGKALFLPMLVFLLAHLYIINSWWCWHYINGFGSRPMVETYAFLALPFAFFTNYCFKKWWTSLLFITTCLFLSSINMFQTYQNNINLLFSEDANGVYVLNTLFKTKISRNNLIEFDIAETQPQSLTNRVLLGQKTFDTLPFSLTSGQYCHIVEGTAETFNLKPGNWLKASAFCRSDNDVGSMYNQSMLVVTIDSKNKKGDNVWKALRIQNKLGNKNNELWNFNKHQWDTVSFCTQIPSTLQKEDVIKLFFWNIQGPPVLIQSVWLEKGEADKSGE